jgi:aspartyl-tRNA(Asn)/glutamyl-tRNA(Gln) amidotransferase subunit C
MTEGEKRNRPVPIRIITRSPLALLAITPITPMITKETIQHLAKLARIELTPEREDQLTKDVSKILDYVEELKAVNTDGLPEISQVTGLKNALREDVPANQLVGEAVNQRLVDCAPASEDGYVKVKAIF